MDHIRQYRIFFSLAFLTLFFTTTVKGISSHICLTKIQNSTEISSEVASASDGISTAVSKTCCDNDNPDCCVTNVKLLDADSYSPSSDVTTTDWVQATAQIAIPIEHNFPTYSFSFLTENEDPPDVAIYIRYQAFLC